MCIQGRAPTLSVSSTIVLPAQPAAGVVSQIGLAGDGYAAPHSETHVRMTVAGDASGGTATLQFTWDARWCSVLSWCSVTIGGLTAAQEVILSYRISANIGAGTVMTVRDPVVSGFSVGATWVPPAQLASVPSIGATQPNLRVVTTNTDVDSYQVDAVLLNFKKDVRQRIPLQTILASLPRGVSAT